MTHSFLVSNRYMSNFLLIPPEKKAFWQLSIVLILANCWEAKVALTLRFTRFNLFFIVVNSSTWRRKSHYSPSEWMRQQHVGWWCNQSLPVIGSVTVLLQEVILNELGNLQSDFISLSKRCLRAQEKGLSLQLLQKTVISEIKSILNILYPFFYKFVFTPRHIVSSWMASPFLQAARFRPGPPPPAESLLPSCAEGQTRGNVCHNIRPELLCICCSWSASSQRGSAFSERASCPIPRTPEKTEGINARKTACKEN